MLRKRLIFTLIYSNGNYMLSRNFRLQKVGNLDWLNKHYSFKDIAFSIDELIVLDATKKEKDMDEFASSLPSLLKNIFVPVSIGGGIRSLEDAKVLFEKGADKIVINTLLSSDVSTVKELVLMYGSQSIIASIDFKFEANEIIVYIKDGEEKLDISFGEYLAYIKELNVGEIYLNSINKDGTGQGYEIEILKPYLENITLPVILAGGAGNAKHLIEGINCKSVDAVATANLFNFIADGLPKAREEMIKCNINLAPWENKWKL